MPPAATVGESRTGLTAWAGIAASVAAVALLLAPGRRPALAGAFLLACVPVGAAVMCWVDTVRGFVQAGLTLVLSLAVTAIVTALMIWLATGSRADCWSRSRPWGWSPAPPGCRCDGGRRECCAACASEATGPVPSAGAARDRPRRLGLRR